MCACVCVCLSVISFYLLSVICLSLLPFCVVRSRVTMLVNNNMRNPNSVVLFSELFTFAFLSNDSFSNF